MRLEFRRPVLSLVIALMMASGSSGQDLPGELVDIGNYSVHLVCRGEGDTTILLDAGAGIGGWSVRLLPLVAQLVSRGVRTCVWDRPGVGLSEAGPLPRTHLQIVEEMKRMIEEAGLETPLILGAHSYGGLNIRLFAAKYPELVEGLVLIDAAHEDQWDRFDPKIWGAVQSQKQAFRQKASAIREGDPEAAVVVDPGQLPPAWKKAVKDVYSDARHYEGVAHEFEALESTQMQFEERRDLKNIPVLVLTAGRSFYAFEGAIDVDVAAANNVWLSLQRDLVGISAEATHIIEPDLDHHLVSDHPGTVADHIMEFTTKLDRNVKG